MYCYGPPGRFLHAGSRSRLTRSEPSPSVEACSRCPRTRVSATQQGRPQPRLHGACERCGIGWLTLCNVSSAVARPFCRISSGLSVLMPSDVSTISDDQSVEELRRELAEAREQQAATAEILTSISSSVADANQVFAKIAASAARLCDAYDATIFQVDGVLLRCVAKTGTIPQDDTLPLTREVVTGRAVLDGRTIYVPDVQAETGEYPVGSDRARRIGHHTILAVPLMRAGGAIGVISIRRAEVRQFTERQIELLKTFADQAVIAIENARQFEAEQASKARADRKRSNARPRQATCSTSSAARNSICSRCWTASWETACAPVCRRHGVHPRPGGRYLAFT